MSSSGEKFDNALDHVIDILNSPHPTQRIIEGIETRVIRFLGKDQKEVKPYVRHEAAKLAISNT